MVRSVSAVKLVIIALMITVVSVTSRGVSLEGEDIRIEFDDSHHGFNCLGIENKVDGQSVWFGRRSSYLNAGMWRLCFWRDGNPSNAVNLTNLSPSKRTMETFKDTLRFYWKGLSFADDNNVIDVVATVTLNAEGTGANWRLAVENRSKKWGLASTEYPIIWDVVASGEASALLPIGNIGGRLYKQYTGSTHDYFKGEQAVYPRGRVPVQTVAFMLGDAGLQFTALDGKAQEKMFDTRGLRVGIWYRCPDEGLPGAANAPDFAVETAVFSGDWWKAAKCYRNWALRQKWTAKGLIARRKDFNRKIGNVGFWVNAGKSGVEVTNAVFRMMKAMPGVPIGVHWYYWHQIPFDHSYPEYFPERLGMSEAVKWLRNNGVVVMPYINGRLWDEDIPSFTNAVSAACKKPDGKSYYIEHYGSKRDLVPMCPTSKVWNERIASVCRQLIDKIGVDSIYLDQISCGKPVACHDVMHGHELGGGPYWTDGYRNFMHSIREYAISHGVSLASESAAEPYLDSFDAFLTWFAYHPQDVPMLPAVYSGYALFFGSDQSSSDSLDSYCALQGKAFLWGCQLGWNSTWLLRESRKDHLEFTIRLCKERLANLEFLLEGELLGEISLPKDIPMVDISWKREHTGTFKLPAIMGTIWCSGDGRRYRAFFVNISGNEQTFSSSTDLVYEFPSISLPAHAVISVDVKRKNESK